MTRETILANATLVLPDETLRGQVRIVDGRIANIAPGADVPQGAEDCGGDLVLPGLIELHTDNLERHIEPRPKVDWPHAAAIIAHDAELASVGITTVFDALRVGSVVSETIGANSGLGQMMLAAQAGFNVELVFAGVMALAILGIALYAITALIEKRFTGWAFRAEGIG